MLVYCLSYTYTNKQNLTNHASVYYDSYEDATSYMKMKYYNEANPCFQLVLRNVKSIVEVKVSNNNSINNVDNQYNSINFESSISSCPNSNHYIFKRWNDYLSSDAMIIISSNVFIFNFFGK